jgi:aspartate/methionine/tyrosine aminotransferase
MPPCFSWSPEEKPHLISLHSNSKWLSSLGRRFGWMEATPAVIAGMEKIIESTLLSPDTLHSMATAQFLETTLPHNQLSGYINEIRGLYKETAQVLTHSIKSISDGTIYIHRVVCIPVALPQIINGHSRFLNRY